MGQMDRNELPHTRYQWNVIFRAYLINDELPDIHPVALSNLDGNLSSVIAESIIDVHRPDCHVCGQRLTTHLTKCERKGVICVRDSNGNILTIEQSAKIWYVNTLLTIIDEVMLCDILDLAELSGELIEKDKISSSVSKDMIEKLINEHHAQMANLNEACNKESEDRKKAEEELEDTKQRIKRRKLQV